VPPLSPAVLQAFSTYDWPGNVRELENACERIAQTNTCGTVHIGCVAASILFRARQETAEPEIAAPLPAATSTISLDDRLREVETTLIRWALDASHGNKSKAAAMLRVKRSTLGDRIKHCGLDQGPSDTGVGSSLVDG
jgi:DNA-binding NtrC family response regulator